MNYRPARCKWDFAKRKKRCCPGCDTLLLIMSDVPTDAELTSLKSFWMWDADKEMWTYIRDWEEHKREALGKLAEYAKAKVVGSGTPEVPHSNSRWIQ